MRKQTVKDIFSSHEINKDLKLYYRRVLFNLFRKKSLVFKLINDQRIGTKSSRKKKYIDSKQINVK